MTSRVALGLFLWLSSIALPAHVTAANEGWRAGWGRANITPEKPMWMAGYGSRDHAAEGKLTDLWAKALVLESPARERFLLVTLDLVGISREFSAAVCGELARRHGLDRAHVMLCTSHTHTGPVVGQNLNAMHYLLLDAAQQPLVEQYAGLLQTRVLESVEQALQAPVACRLSWGSGKSTLAVNRRTNVEANVPQARLQGQLLGPVDHDVPVLAVRDEGGKLRVVVFGYACHATVLSFYQWSGDYPGFAQLELEALLPDCQAMFWAGCGGDQNPLPRRTVELAQEYGRRLALAVKDVVDAPMEPLAGEVTARYDEIPLEFGALPTREELQQQAQSSDRFVASRGRMWLERVERGESLPTTYPYPIASWRFGDRLEWIFLGGEVVVDYAARLKSERRWTRTWVTAYANDVMAYIPSRRVLLEGGYEGGGAMVYYGLPTIWAESCEPLIIAGVQGQLGLVPRP